MKLHRLLILTGLFIFLFSLYKIWQELRGLDECSPFPWPLEGCRAEMELNAWKRRNSNGWIIVPQDRPL